ncbi:cytochrome P450 6k1-like [Pieris napi]|uniref:cytochrome P450 6k1-like n=1 Tax=Pieris napi TaxID=78633 RepID=UPI001FBB2D43|nr:cytochrome P450 6k1-like [Pieris napi]XP_047510729.1 cytochrome P450 6k1-like [Pieris napi]
MFGIIVCGVLVSLISWIYLRWRNVREYWARRGVPHLPPHPLMGSLTFLQQKNPALWMIDTYKQFKKPYVGIWLFWRPALIINSPEIARNILIKDFDNFRNRFMKPGSFDPFKNSLFTANDPMWSSMRRGLTSVFTSSKLKSMQGLFDQKANDLIQRIKNTKDTSKLEIRSLLTDYTTDLIATAAFGVETTATRTGEDPIRTVTNTLMTFDWYKGLCWSTIFFFPKLTECFRFPIFSESSTQFFKKVFETVSKQRRDNGIKEVKDLLDAILKLKDDDLENKQGYTDNDIWAQAVTFLFAGFETSSSVLSFMLYELSFRPDLQEKMYEELIEAKKSQNGPLDLTIQADLKYLNCVFKEALRMYPPLGWLDRETLNDYKVDENLTIPAGTPIYVNGIGMQYDSDVYPDPETFNPERFLPENEKDLKPFTYMPFGEGPRSCIAKRFAQISVRNAMSYLVLNFKFKPLPGAPKPSEVKYENKHLFLVPGESLFIDFEPRNVSVSF